MNAMELHLPDGRPAGVHYCSQCRNVFGGMNSQPRAEQCCQNYRCSDCGQDTGSRYMLRCRACVTAGEEAAERKKFEAAEKLTRWDGFIYDGNEYFDTVDCFLDYLAGEDRPVPEYVWACRSKAFVKPCLDSLLDSFMDESYEDFEPSDLHGLEELKQSLARFEEANKEVVSYLPDYSKAVLLAGYREHQEEETP